MKLTEAKIRKAQAVIEAVMAETGGHCITMYNLTAHNYECGVIMENSSYLDDAVAGNDLADLYINRLHELNGTEPPPF